MRKVPPLKAINNPPKSLHVRGNLPLHTKIAAISGSRRTTQQAFMTAGRIGKMLAEHGYTIVTGAAYGCDDAIEGEFSADGFMYRKVNYAVLSVLLLISAVFSYDLGHTHPGRTDANGGHYNRQTGEYHKHVKEDSPAAKTGTDPVISQESLSSDANPSELRLAAWNIRIMSNKSRTDAELTQIARTLADYDFIAIVELRDEIVLQRTQRILSQMGKAYDYQFSPAVGRGSKERYAFLYKSSVVSVVRRGELYPDAADGEDNFARDPYWATFRAGAFDFSVIAVHVIWGDRVGPRKAEVRALADVYRYVQEANGTEDDVLLVGDFNHNATDTESYRPIMRIPSMIRLFDFPQKSHIKDSSLYDNIFFQKNHVTEYLGRSGIDRFDETDFGNDDKAANLAVSDHRPVWAVFSITQDDDGSNAGGSEPEPFQPPEDPPVEDVSVYVTRTGKKYHLGSCSSLRRSRIPISLSEAKQRYGPCSRCNPPR